MYKKTLRRFGGGFLIMQKTQKGNLAVFVKGSH